MVKLLHREHKDSQRGTEAQPYGFAFRKILDEKARYLALCATDISLKGEGKIPAIK